MKEWNLDQENPVDKSPRYYKSEDIEKLREVYQADHYKFAIRNHPVTKLINYIESLEALLKT